MSALKRLEDYIDDYESKSFSLSRSRLSNSSMNSSSLHRNTSMNSSSALRNTKATPVGKSPERPVRSITRSPALTAGRAMDAGHPVSTRKHVNSLPPPNPVSTGSSDGSTEQELEYFISALRRRAKVRAHELKQMRRMLMADLDWDCDFSIDTKVSSIMHSRSDLSEDEFQSLLLGETVTDMPTRSPAMREEPLYNNSLVDATSQVPITDSFEFTLMDFDRLRNEKIQRLQSLARSVSQPTIKRSDNYSYPLPKFDDPPPPPPAQLISERQPIATDRLARYHRYQQQEHIATADEEELRPTGIEESGRGRSSGWRSPPLPRPTQRPMALDIAGIAAEQDSLAKLHHNSLQEDVAKDDISSSNVFLRARSGSPHLGEDGDLFALANEELQIEGLQFTPSKLPKTPSVNPIFS